MQKHEWLSIRLSEEARDFFFKFILYGFIFMK